jgi:hypothetical protein
MDSLAVAPDLTGTAMSRRSTPERIDAARRAATRNRLIGERVTEARADAWIAAWEARAAQDGLERGSAYWQAAWEWIAEQRASRRLPAKEDLARHLNDAD